jgi:RNAse (barnase) inhibitor barstar
VSPREFDLDLTRPTQNGVYFVAATDLDDLARRASREELHVNRTSLAGCRDKAGLLQRLAMSLKLPASFGYNWDALADCLRDIDRLPAWGRALLFEHTDELRQAAAADFDMLLGVLDDAATFGSEHDVPWFAFLALPDTALDQHSPPA